MQRISLIIFLFLGGIAKGQDIKVVSDFPGGNIMVSKISQDTVLLKPDLSFTNGKWFYWYFKVSNMASKTITFKFEQNNVFAKYGPAYSINNNYSWEWYGENSVKNNSFTYTFSNKDTIAYFSVSYPYTKKNLTNFLIKLNDKNSISIDTLCITKENRAVEKILISQNTNKPKRKVIITARHHACEVTASYVLEGLIKSISNDKSLKYLRENVEFLIIPFMDKDGVENGEQGKNRIPRDHNRDYDSISIHSSTAALRSFLPQWGKGELVVAVDLHSPGLFGSPNEVIYMVGSKDTINEKMQIRFSKLLEKYSRGEMKSYHADFLHFGEAWNTDNNYTKGLPFSKWAMTLDGMTMATTIEVPYANISGVPFSKDAARKFGKTIAYSLNDYLKLMAVF